MKKVGEKKNEVNTLKVQSFRKQFSYSMFMFWKNIKKSIGSTLKKFRITFYVSE